ncbi:MAG: membrane protein insertion efficiency factor YidD [Pseudomonadota bacterium]|nr:membrane protein insertion efficiency factor YidD [Pseudomonadota bacterium]
MTRKLLIFPVVISIIFLIRLYQWIVSPFLPMSCRFLPSCSCYALEAFYKHGPIGGLFLTIKRLCKCHPWGGSGHDPVPDCLSKSRSSS